MTRILLLSPDFHEFYCSTHVSDGFADHACRRLLELLFQLFIEMHLITGVQNLNQQF